MTPKPCDVLCVGLIVADHVCAPIERMPPAGTLITTERLELTIGGCASNVAVDLAKLNVTVGISGRVGNDALGRFVLEELQHNHVCCDYVELSSSSQTAATQVVNVRGEDRRFIHSVGANAEITGLELPDEALAQAKLLYVGGFGLNAALSGKNVASLFRRAHEHNVTTVLDVVIGDEDRIRELLPEALPETDLFLPNTDESQIITGLSDPWEQAAMFRRGGAKTVIVTCGKDGVVALDSSNRRFAAPSHRVEQVDGTGGGDAFVSGFLYGMLHQAPLTDCIQYGAAMGASCVKTAGATTGVFREQEMLDFVAANPLHIQCDA